MASRNQPDLTGRQFDRLKVIGRYGNDPVEGRSWWQCDCSCGGKRVATRGALVKGKCRSCGCLQAEHARRNLVKATQSRAAVYGRNRDAILAAWPKDVQRWRAA